MKNNNSNTAEKKFSPETIMKFLTAKFADSLEANSFSYDTVFCHIKRKSGDLFPHKIIIRLASICSEENLNMIFSAEENEVPVISLRHNKIVSTPVDFTKLNNQIEKKINSKS